ncbi:MAG: TIGR04282 family arsenosugar biosynthesis glycosyltransferase [Gammaproteobacteria bacterium]|nr:TIGR04282 family arsenosugar biosynthesis glycosyltransferase [Gammaproteobacteria bacterium]
MTFRNFLYSDTLIIIFAREPVPGQVKTRLIPTLGEQGATQLYKQLLDYAVSNMIDWKFAPVNLCITPESNKSYFIRNGRYRNVELSVQKGENLGSRMHNALASALQNYPKALLIGTDCPFLSRDDLQQAIMALDGNDMVFSPARDGGYVLVGAKRLVSDLFEDIDWGTERVMAQSRIALSRYDFRWQELSEQYDIDTKEDLRYLLQHNEFKNIFD